MKKALFASLFVLAALLFGCNMTSTPMPAGWQEMTNDQLQQAIAAEMLGEIYGPGVTFGQTDPAVVADLTAIVDNAVNMRTNAAAVCVGINRVDPAVYGSDMALPDCELDAVRFANRTREAGIPTAVLLTEEATWNNVVSTIRAAVESLPDDGSGRLFLSLSGHGGRTRDLNGDEADGYDSFLCFYDRTVLDDIIGDLLAGIDKSLLVFVVCDTCHSGTAFKDMKPYIPSPGGMPPDMMVRVIWQGGCRDFDYSQSTGRGGICSMAVQAQDFLFDAPYKVSNNAMDQAEAKGQIMECNEFGPVTDADRYEPFIKESE